MAKHKRDPLCLQHRRGVEPLIQGQNWRNRNCCKCDEKVALGKVTEDAPTSTDLLRAIVSRFKNVPVDSVLYNSELSAQMGALEDEIEDEEALASERETVAA